MAEAPPVPKRHRAALLARAALTGAARAAAATEVASERAALSWRQCGEGAPAEEVIFALPMVAPEQVGDWAAVEARLAATLDGLLGQSDGRWRAVICCQERPALPDDPRITHLPYNDPRPGNDKWRKLSALAHHLAHNMTRPAFVMSFDADDLPHPALVADMLHAPGANGWRIDDGLVLNAATGAVGQAGRPTLAQPLRKPFWKLCGSCAAFRIDPTDPQGMAALAAFWQHEHRMFPYLARLAGRALRPLDGGRVLYMLNHGENFGARRGRVGFKPRFVERFRIADPDHLRQIAEDFRVETEAP